MAIRVKYNINVNFTLSDPIKETKTSSVASNRITFKDGVNQDALIIFDGVRLPNNSQLSTIDPNNIESISVLKDQAATALYGPRAKAGAIVITSKTKNSVFRNPDAKELSIDKNTDFFDLKRKL